MTWRLEEESVKMPTHRREKYVKGRMYGHEFGPHDGVGFLIPRRIDVDCDVRGDVDNCSP